MTDNNSWRDDKLKAGLERLKKPKPAGGSGDATAPAYEGVERPNISGVMAEIGEAEKRAEALLKPQKKEPDDLICWCNNPRCCANGGRPFVSKTTGKPVLGRKPRYC